MPGSKKFFMRFDAVVFCSGTLMSRHGDQKLESCCRYGETTPLWAPDLMIPGHPNPFLQVMHLAMRFFQLCTLALHLGRSSNSNTHVLQVACENALHLARSFDHFSSNTHVLRVACENTIHPFIQIVGLDKYAF